LLIGGAAKANATPVSRACADDGHLLVVDGVPSSLSDAYDRACQITFLEAREQTFDRLHDETSRLPLPQPTPSPPAWANVVHGPEQVTLTGYQENIIRSNERLSESQKLFLERMLLGALQLRSDGLADGVNLEVMVAQAIWETYWGRDG